MSVELQKRFDYLIERLRSTYDGIGYSSGRPYVYFVYHPSFESQVHRLVLDQLRSDTQLTFHHIDILQITIDSLAGQEEQRQRLLDDPRKTDSTSGIMRLWTRRTHSAIMAYLKATKDGERPVITLRGLAALHPLGTPSTLMESLAEQEPRNPRTNGIVPIVLFIPGVQPPQSSHIYWFLGQERFRANFYRGEEI